MNPLAITSLKPTPKTIIDKRYFASIDKASFSVLTHRLSAKVVKSSIENLIERGLSYGLTEGYFKNHKARIEVRTPSNALIYLQAVGTSDIIHTIITNPSQCASLADYIEEIDRLIGGDILRASKIKRFDIAIDFLQDFEELTKILDVSYKATASTANYKSANIDFISFGKSQSGEYIKAYDKSKFFQCGSKVARVEIQFTTPKIRKIEIDSFFGLINFIRKRGLSSLLKNLRLRDYEILKASNAHNQKKSDMLQGALLIAPLSTVRRRLNTHKNFKRNYSKVLRIKEENIQFWWLAHIGLMEWIEKGSDYEL